jgi:hypothetical protein
MANTIIPNTIGFQRILSFPFGHAARNDLIKPKLSDSIAFHRRIDEAAPQRAAVIWPVALSMAAEPLNLALI